jgi:uncharacterized membrane protein YdjX (TVP38/TMEM64 family)
LAVREAKAVARHVLLIRIAVLFAALGGIVFLNWTADTTNVATLLREFSDQFAPHRRAWYALPVVALAFVVLGLAMVPVLLLIAATGVLFGPWLGPVYAMAGCLASASIGFAIGRWTGLGRIERIGGRRATRMIQALERNGTLAVFLLRKIPAPFLIANVVAGASRVRFRDFIAGTVLGMTAVVVALAGFGYQLTNLLQGPSPAKVLGAVVIVGIPLTLAWFVNRMLRQPPQAA